MTRNRKLAFASRGRHITLGGGGGRRGRPSGSSRENCDEREREREREADNVTYRVSWKQFPLEMRYSNVVGGGKGWLKCLARF